MNHKETDIENRPLAELTLGEILPYIRRIISEEIKGMAGLAEVLHCSIKTAYNYRSTGDYDLAIIRFGKRIIIDKVKATEIAQAQGKSRTDKPATI